jgi:hypothetical protein
MLVYNDKQWRYYYIATRLEQWCLETEREYGKVEMGWNVVKWDKKWGYKGRTVSFLTEPK